MSAEEYSPAGMHHVSILTRSAERTHRFLTRTLGFQLSVKSVNQERYGMYHLFYSDAAATPGTLLTFFDMPMAALERPGTGSFSRTELLIGSSEALSWWAERLSGLEILHSGTFERDGRRQLEFEGPEGLALSLVAGSPSGVASVAVPGTEVPPDFRILGLGAAHVKVEDAARTGRFLDLLGFRPDRSYATAEGSALVHVVPAANSATEIHVEESVRPARRYGSGGVHHVALTVRAAEGIARLLERAEQAGHEVTEVMDRGWFHSGYITGPEGIVIELATPDPGFIVRPGGIPLHGPLTLPAFLEAERQAIEQRLRPLQPESPEA